MTINVGINDFERIGRQVSRATLGHLLYAAPDQRTNVTTAREIARTVLRGRC